MCQARAYCVHAAYGCFFFYVNENLQLFRFAVQVQLYNLEDQKTKCEHSSYYIIEIPGFVMGTAVRVGVVILGKCAEKGTFT